MLMMFKKVRLFWIWKLVKKIPDPKKIPICSMEIYLPAAQQFRPDHGGENIHGPAGRI